MPDPGRWLLRVEESAGGKIPYSIGMKDDSPFVFAGLWEGWKDPATDEWLRTCTIITGEPNELVAQIHTRMPVILPEEDHAKWLGEAEDGDRLGQKKAHFLVIGGTSKGARAGVG
jgi:putative SOS response-associated peptidase YedK